MLGYSWMLSLISYLDVFVVHNYSIPLLLSYLILDLCTYFSCRENCAFRKRISTRLVVNVTCLDLCWSRFGEVTFHWRLFKVHDETALNLTGTIDLQTQQLNMTEVKNLVNNTSGGRWILLAQGEITIYKVVCVQLAHFSIGDWQDISIAHVIIIIKLEVSTFAIVIIFYLGCVP